jgi:hypothetical protein
MVTQVVETTFHHHLPRWKRQMKTSHLNHRLQRHSIIAIAMEDLQSVPTVEQLLLHYGGGTLMVSHYATPVDCF